MARVPTLPGEGEVLPRYVFLESLIPKARVLEVGAISLTGGHSASFLVTRGAASVARAKDDPEVERNAVELSDVPLETLSGQSFDLVLVHDADPRTLDAQ